MSDRKKTETESTTAMVAVPTGWNAVGNLAEAIQVAEIVAKANALPDIRNAGQALLKIMAGAEMGFGAFASLVDVHIIEGKPSVGAHLRAAAIKRSTKYDYDVVEKDEAGTACELAFFERVALTGGETRKMVPGWKKVGSIRWTYAQAEAKGLTKGASGVKKNWKSSPSAMLFARAISEGYRTFCADLSGGVLAYDPDELDSAPVVEPPVPAVPAARPAHLVIDAEAVRIPAPEPEGNGQMPAAEIPEEKVARFAELARLLDIPAAAMIERFQKAYGVDSFRKLTPAQADEVLGKLESRAAQLTPAQAG